jgi:hypothetical protein
MARAGIRHVVASARALVVVSVFSVVSIVSIVSLASLGSPGVAGATNAGAGADASAENDFVDLRHATIVTRPGSDVPAPERTAARVLKEELQKRLGADLPIVTAWPATGAAASPSTNGSANGGAAGTPATASAPREHVVIALASGLVSSDTSAAPSPWRGVSLPKVAPERRAEGYRLLVERRGADATVWILGADARGALFGVGELLRALRWSAPASGRANLANPASNATAAAVGTAQGLPATLDIATAPAYAIRGHQLGYRQHSNTYDGWSPQQYEQYIRELALFGANSIENIPFQDDRVSPLFTLPRDQMNRAISEICARYGLDYWIWTPADFDLKDAALRTKALDDFDTLFRQLPRLDAVFFPGGDPGDNPARLMVPYLHDIATRLRRHHPHAKVWLSLQWFKPAEIDWLYDEINREPLEWFGGLVAGPSSPPLNETRRRLDARYQLRDYPDVTHVVRCQYPLLWWDPALNFTLGREPINPRAAFYSALHDRIASFTNGFISYSDGVNDDVNKAVWSRKSWAPASQPREILIDYARVFFGEAVAERAADGLLALEKNWDGPLATNGGVDATLALWRQLEGEQPSLADNWRWQQALLRAYYDAYTRHRLIADTAREQEANRALAGAARTGSAAAIAAARAILARADADATAGPAAPWRRRIEELSAALFSSIRMQLSMPKYQASGAERGAVLDFVDYPLNNRWWLEDEFTKIAALPDERARVAALARLSAWEDPGPGGFYDVLGDVGRSPHVVHAKIVEGDPLLDDGPIPHFTWESDAGGKSRKRLTWQTSLRWPLGLEYDQIDRAASYIVRLNGTGDVRLRINGQPVNATAYSKTLGDPKEYRVPADAIKTGHLVLTFDAIDESDRNWRQFSRVSEAWLIKQ